MKSALDLTTDIPETWCVDIQGWHSTDPIFKKLIDEVKPKTICEVGSWKGASAIHMASLTTDLGTRIYCVDTWLGGVDHMLSDLPQDHIPKNDGFPHLYYQFLHNIRESGYADRIFPVPNTSSNCARYFKAKDMKFDLVYIDGDHTTEGCLMDIIFYRDLLNPNGVLFGDDYAWPSVQKAVSQYLAKKPDAKGFVEEETGHWIIR